MRKIEVELMPFTALIHVTTDQNEHRTLSFSHHEFRNLAQQTREAIVNLDGRETVICAAHEIELGDRVMGNVVVTKTRTLGEIKFSLENRSVLTTMADSIFSIERKIS